MAVTAEDLRSLVRDDDEAVFTDEQLDAALLAAGDNLLRAAGIAFQALAAEYAQIGRSTKTDDLSLDTRTRGADMLAVARSYFTEANAAEQGEANDFFQIVPLAKRSNTCVRPEATPWPLGCC